MGRREKNEESVCVPVCEKGGGSRHSAEMKWRPATVLKDTVCHYVIRNVHR